MRKTLATFTLGAVLAISGTALAHHGGMHVARYRQISGPAFFPAHVVIRCAGWAEDSAATLRLVDYSPDRAVYRCVTP